MANYPALQATAQRLVDVNGGDVTFRQFEQDPANPAEPWDGPADPRGSLAAELVQRAVLVQPTGISALGIAYVTTDLLKRSEQIMIVAGTDGVDLSEFNEVDTIGGSYKIVGIERLQPDGATILLWYVGVAR